MIVAEQLGIGEERITPESRSVEGLGADSLDTVELVMPLEEAFGIEIPAEAAERIRTFRDVPDYVKSR